MGPRSRRHPLGGSPTPRLASFEQHVFHSCFLIADFGIGSDSPIIVNVEHKGLPVSYLYWTVKGYKNGITEWRPITDLGSFVADIFPDGPSRPPFRRASSIEVNGARYYWRSSFGADDLTVLVQHVSGIGQQVEAQWVRPPRTARNLPKSVKELINHALAQGWTPQVAAPALRLTAMDSVITIDTF